MRRIKCTPGHRHSPSAGSSCRAARPCLTNQMAGRGRGPRCQLTGKEEGGLSPEDVKLTSLTNQLDFPGYVTPYPRLELLYFGKPVDLGSLRMVQLGLSL